jgi:pantetheine-phosphate adenylyltransferase
MRVAIYPGSFDPVTLGHWDLIQRARKLADRLIVAILHNPTKSCTFSSDERADFLRELLLDTPGVEVTIFHGLLVDFASQQRADFIIRGVRAFSDFEYEFQMALMNRKLAPNLETVFLMPKEDCGIISSRMVREVGVMGGDISGLVPALVLKRIASRLNDSRPAIMN